MTIDWRPFTKIVQESQSFVLTSHMRPDCDAIGSELGLALALRSLGKTVRIINGDGVPPHIGFIDPNKDVLVLGQDVDAANVTCDVHIVVDTSAWGQLGPMADVIRTITARKVNIDHHVSQDDLGAVVFKDVTSESTGRLIVQAIDALGVRLSPEMATPLFAAMGTDTGWFRFPSVTAETLDAAAKLVAAGAKPSAIFAALYEQNTLARLLLQGRILTKVKSHLGGRLLTTAITQDDLKAVGAESTDTEDVINRLLSVAKVEAALLFLELGPQETKVSLRSRSTLDVNAVAAQFGGGGHKAASGVRYHGPLSEAEPKVIEAMIAAMK
ncbi:MAG TPA: bifunctional oligoribonuclease/PAP phosphatase NrnA [Lacipirellulaceae bacterium]|jgi:phosphoesterase RecJ-like protein|nr:bifunctional oligoribonuclease/PAP phosphatase NrnA [Lacipirellulaceae bacterium]